MAFLLSPREILGLQVDVLGLNPFCLNFRLSLLTVEWGGFAHKHRSWVILRLEAFAAVFALEWPTESWGLLPRILM